MNTQKAIFVTGTDTGIGKTVVSAILMLAFAGLYWKPVQTGSAEDITDREWIQNLTLLSREHFVPETYVLKAPCSPHLAAEQEQVSIELEKITKAFPGKTYSPLIVEGAGGVLVPLNRDQFMLDLMKELSLPVLVVSSSRLGTINHSLLTLECIRRAGLDVRGFILSGPKDEHNKTAIEKYGHTQVLAEVDYLPELNRKTISRVAGTIPDFFQPIPQVG